jgi:hypothetical protein
MVASRVEAWSLVEDNTECGGATFTCLYRRDEICVEWNCGERAAAASL